MRSASIGRNELCPCASGKKYKNCCMNSMQQPVSHSSLKNLSKRRIEEIFQSALAQHQKGNFAQADALYRQVIDADPSHADALHLLGVLAGQFGKRDLAIELIGEAIRLNPSAAVYHNNLGFVFSSLGCLDMAEASYRQAIKLQPQNAEAHNNLGALLQADGKLDQACEIFREALRRWPEHVDALNNLGVVLQHMGDLDGAAASLQKALALRPGDGELHANLGNVRKDQGRLTEAMACFRQALSLRPDFREAFSSMLMAMSYDPGCSPLEILAAHQQYGKRFAESMRSRWPTFGSDLDPQRKLRIGFVSGDLRIHPVGFFLEGVLGRLDQKRFDIVLYPTLPRVDEVSERLRAGCSSWVPLVGMTDAEAFQRVRDDAIDILVDLSGHTAHNRLGLMVKKPAPVQVTWLGYFATTGVAAIDYILCDPFSVPADDAWQFVETPWRLPDTRLCFTPPGVPIVTGRLPALSNGYVTFGCFNNLAKVNEAVIGLWSRILAAVPESRLLLKAKQLEDEGVRSRMVERFRACGCRSSKLVLEGWSSRSDYLESYNRVDIALDTFPFTGGTTSVEGLWMGVPLITLRGDRMLSRQGEGILRNIELTDWIAIDEDAYVAGAVARAGDLAALSGLRTQLRARLLASPLCDAERFAGNLENAFRGMWSRFCAAESRVKGVT